MSRKLVYGVGINDGKYPSNINKKPVKEYKLWVDMLKRCYSESLHKDYPTYIDCTVSDNFKNYSYFYEWCNEQIGFGLKGFELDKDLLIKGNKIYSEDTCLFLPKNLNYILLKCDSKRGCLPIGVNKKGDKFQVNIRMHGKKSYLGSFDTVDEAFNTYKNAKERYLKEIVEKYKSQIDERAYNAIANYKIEIID